MKNSQKVLMTAAAIALTFLPGIVMAAGPGFGSGVNDGGGGACAPIDGNIGMLIAAGAGYGAKLIAGAKRKTSSKSK